jgi:diguanylate cyclase (GGDEF)-like protein/PAS domain S-box-containing protein
MKPFGGGASTVLRRHAITVIALMLAAALLGLGGHSLAQNATRIVAADFAGSYVDLVSYLGGVASDRAKISVQVPSSVAGTTQSMQLEATRPGTTHRWAIFTVANPGPEPLELVVDSARQSFPGSGIFQPSHRSSRIASTSTSNGPDLRKLNAPDRDAYALTLAPMTSMTVALELSELGVNGLRLWKRAAFDSTTTRQTMFRGVVIGMSALAVLVISCLVVLSPQIAFPLSAIFAWAAIGFITLETGMLQPVVARLVPAPIPSDDVLGAIVEALMAAGVLLMGVTIMRTRRQLPALSALLMVAGGACIGLAVYSWFEPMLVKQIVRAVFAAAVAIVLLTAATLVMRGGLRARSSLLVWLLLGAWTVGAGYIAMQRPPSELASPILVGGLAVVLVVLAFVLTYFAFSSVLNPELDALVAERNMLALAGGEQVVWDYQPGDNSFHVGEHLESLLGYEPESLSTSSLQAWFNLVHPSDMPALESTLESARSRANQPFRQQFRLRHADGRYRWYELKGRSLLNAAETGLRLSGLLSDASQERTSQDRILSDAIHDVVTGLPNYALYLDRLNQAVGRAAASPDKRLAVMLLDLDRFRFVNARLGQEIGDSLLKAIARRLEKLLPEGSSLARLPGDQFAVIHERSGGDGEGLDDLVVLVDRLRQAVSLPVRVPPNEIYLTCCMGVAEWDPYVESADTLHQYAEVALFDAKKRGKDHVAFYKPGMRAEDDANRSLSVEDLQHALQEQRFEIAYQPIMRMSDRQLAGFEALVRLRRRDGLLLEPSSFVPLAERCGLIGEIGAHVLSEAARQLGVWQRMFTPAEPVFVSVNISSVQLAGNRLIHVARTILGREELAPGTLKLELTETMVMENPELSLQVLDRLKALGIGLSCDDFGTGYSSLAYLRRLPFDTLKVDRSFLIAGLEDERGSVVLDAIILLAHDLGLQVVCEGVETDAQMQHLAELECDLVQGFLIGEPIDAQQVLEALGAPSRDPAGSASGIAAMWHRLSRRKPVAPPPPRVLVPEPAPEDDQLAPWSPYDFHPAPWAPNRPIRHATGPQLPAPSQASGQERGASPQPVLQPAADEKPEPEQPPAVAADIETVSRQVREALHEDNSAVPPLADEQRDEVAGDAVATKQDEPAGEPGVARKKSAGKAAAPAPSENATAAKAKPAKKRRRRRASKKKPASSTNGTKPV